MKALEGFTEKELKFLLYDWSIWARPSQLLPPGDWRTWLIQAGRGFGKTRTGAETVKQWVDQGVMRIALVAETPADARDVMIEGESGIMSIFPDDEKPTYEPSKRRLTFKTGAVASVFSGYAPDQLRGPQHEKAWCDELCAWQYAQETWDMLMFGLRLGKSPQVIVTTTPKPIPLLKALRKLESTRITTGSTYENRENLAEAFFSEIITKYEGTRLGRQELEAELLDDNPSALWKRPDIDRFRVNTPPTLKRVVVAIDPATTSGENANETGIIVGGLGEDGHGYILADVSIKGTPKEWGTAAIKAYHRWLADKVVGEVNNGGEMIKYTIHSIEDTIPFKGVHATKGKYTRAEPVSSLYEQGRVHHVGTHAHVEDQMCEWEPGMDSPDRLDALVWCLTELMLGGGAKTVIVAPGGVGKTSKWRK